MKVAIMQPYFFPYIGYYTLLKQTDKFILFDPVQFIRHGWIERNRILKPAEGWQFISVPLEKYGRDTLIKDIKIRVAEDWKGKIFRQIEHYKKAPFYKQTIELMYAGMAVETDSIVKLNENILKATCEYLGIKLDIKVFTEMDVEMEEVTHAGEWALNISKAIGAKEYINPVGGIEIFRNDQFVDAGIKLTFMGNKLTPYSQRRAQFEPGLSIIDAMMFNDVDGVNKLIDDTLIVGTSNEQTI